MALVVAVALARLLLHLLTNHNYGFHRDELATLDDALHMDWGFVAYPPITPAIGRVAMELFGLSTNGVRFFGALAQSVAIVLTGDMARRLGGNRIAQLLAALCVAAAPMSLGGGALFQYVTFDYLWWVLLAWCFLRLLLSEDPRWWMGVGAAIGLGMMTKYTMGVFVTALAVGVLATPARKYLRSPWVLAGAGIALLIYLPNLIWQIRHDFISLEFLRSIHDRDVRIGRTDGFLLHQLWLPANIVSLPVWLAGLWFYLRRRDLRALGVLYLAVLTLFAVLRGRDYYMGPAYPMLLAAGAVVAAGWRPVWRNTLAVSLVIGGLVFAAIVTPMAPVGSEWFYKAAAANGDLKEEIGWPELTDAVAHVFQKLPEQERAAAGILAGNYGEAGAINLYGGKHGLPRAMSGIDSHWLRGYVEPPPQTVVAIGFSREFLERKFEQVETAGRVVIPYGVQNEEAGKPQIYVCRRLRQSWPEFWRNFRYFG